VPLRGLKRRSNLIGGTAPRGTRDCRSFVTPDSDPGSVCPGPGGTANTGMTTGGGHPIEDCFGLSLRNDIIDLPHNDLLGRHFAIMEPGGMGVHP